MSSSCRVLQIAAVILVVFFPIGLFHEGRILNQTLNSNSGGMQNNTNHMVRVIEQANQRAVKVENELQKIKQELEDTKQRAQTAEDALKQTQLEKLQQELSEANARAKRAEELLSNPVNQQSAASYTNSNRNGVRGNARDVPVQNEADWLISSSAGTNSIIPEPQVKPRISTTTDTSSVDVSSRADASLNQKPQGQDKTPLNEDFLVHSTEKKLNTEQERKKPRTTTTDTSSVHKERVQDASEAVPDTRTRTRATDSSNNIDRVGARIQATPVRTNPNPVRNHQAPAPTIKIQKSQPLFVLSLPNHNDLVLPRYFECAGYKDKIGRYWNKAPAEPFNLREKARIPLGKCLEGNLNGGRPILQGCGDYPIYMDMQHLKPPFHSKKECFDPVFHPGLLEALYKEYPEATILNVVRDPVKWFHTLNPLLPQKWDQFCNYPENPFPTGEDVRSEAALVQFYNDYQMKLRQLTERFPTWKHVEINLEEPQSSISHQLKEQFGFPEKCYEESVEGQIPIDFDPRFPQLLLNQTRPNHIGYPVLVTSMPKAGTLTAHGYFGCGLGSHVIAHQWTNIPSEEYSPKQIGKCFQKNAQEDHYPVFDGCGYNDIWSDTGVLAAGGECYYLFMDPEGLERFYRSYPYGTIINGIRETDSWVDSAYRWRNIQKRWIANKCLGFPEEDMTRKEWGHWYEGVQLKIRNFALAHPTLTYIEVPLHDKTGDILNDIFSFSDVCWGHENVNQRQPAPQELLSNHTTQANL